MSENSEKYTVTSYPNSLYPVQLAQQDYKYGGVVRAIDGDTKRLFSTKDTTTELWLKVSWELGRLVRRNE